MTKLEDQIVRIVESGGNAGVTARQIAVKMGMKRETISHYLWMLKKTGRVKNVHRNLWVKADRRQSASG